MALSDDLELNQSAPCSIVGLVEAIGQIEPDWATDWWDLFHNHPEIHGSSLAKAVNRANLRLNLSGSVSAGTLNRCRRGDCATDHAH